MNWDTAPQELDELRAQVTAEQLQAAILRTEVIELRRELAFHSHQYAKDLAAMTKERDDLQDKCNNFQNKCRAAQLQVEQLQAAIRKAQLKVPLGMEHDGCWWILQEALEATK